MTRWAPSGPRVGGGAMPRLPGSWLRFMESKELPRPQQDPVSNPGPALLCSRLPRPCHQYFMGRNTEALWDPPDAQQSWGQPTLSLAQRGVLRA